MRSWAERAGWVCVGLVLVVGATGCEGAAEPEQEIDIEDVTALEERPCPEGSELSYDNFGGPFILDWCSGCHASALPVGERQGAPQGSDFDTLDRIRAAAPRIWARSGDHNVTMPPEAGPDDQERAMLGEWLACGAP